MVNPTTTAYASAVTPPGKRPHSIAVFGCTGNAGRAVAYHTIKSSLLRKPTTNNAAADSTTIAVSGRNRAKVEKVLKGIRDELRDEGVASAVDVKVDIIVADASDEQSMLELAKSTNVLISCAGPYGRYGEAAVKACVEGGAHYVDITGEQPFIERMIYNYGTRAEEAGVTLCPFSGYDCVPSELGMWLVGKALETQGSKLSDVALNFRTKGGGFPHGTIETILDAADGKSAAPPPRKEGTPRFYPKEYRNVANGALSASNFLLPRYQLGQFTGPNFMGVVNVPILCRAAPAFGLDSNALTISDRSVIGGRPTLLNGYGFIQSQMYIAGLLIGGIALAIPPFRGWLRNKISTYSYNGDPSGKVFVNAKGTSINKKTHAIAKCMYPGDAGIYATGLFATGVANSLLEATTCTTSVEGLELPMPIAGFHSPVVALQGCRDGLLVENLRELGAEIALQVVSDGDMGDAVTVDVDAAKLRSKL